MNLVHTLSWVPIIIAICVILFVIGWIIVTQRQERHMSQIVLVDNNTPMADGILMLLRKDGRTTMRFFKFKNPTNPPQYLRVTYEQISKQVNIPDHTLAGVMVRTNKGWKGL